MPSPSPEFRNQKHMVCPEALPLYEALLPLVIAGENEHRLNPAKHNPQTFKRGAELVDISYPPTAPKELQQIESQLAEICNSAMSLPTGRIRGWVINRYPSLRATLQPRELIDPEVIGAIVKYCGKGIDLIRAREICSLVKVITKTSRQNLIHQNDDQSDQAAIQQQPTAGQADIKQEPKVKLTPIERQLKAKKDLGVLLFKLLDEIEGGIKVRLKIPNLTEAAIEILTTLKDHPQIDHTLFNDWIDFVVTNSPKGSKLDINAELIWLGNQFDQLIGGRKDGHNAANWILRQLMTVGVLGIKEYLSDYNNSELKTVVAALMHIHSVCFPKQVPVDASGNPTGEPSRLKISNIFQEILGGNKIKVEDLKRIAELVGLECEGDSIRAVKDSIILSTDKVRNPKKYKGPGGGGD